MSEIDFYQKHLDGVSRSFAFCIKQLRSPMRTWVSLTYLICRILDTLEDAPWPHKQEQLKLFNEFQKSLTSPDYQSSLIGKDLSLPAGISSGEKKLLGDSQEIFAGLHRAPQSTKKIIQDMVQSMSLGMQFFLMKRQDGCVKMRSLSELNQYCFFVAGVVGEALSKLLSSVDSEFKLKRELVIRSFHFGLFLQKINILKDQKEDEKEGRFFVPDRSMVYKSLLGNAENAFVYICEIPDQHLDYKLFCSWSFFLGLASLPHIEESFETGKAKKISRLETWNLLEKIRKNISNKDFTSSLYREMIQPLQAFHLDHFTKVDSVTTKEDMNFLNCYLGDLTSIELKELGLIA